jgi:hypothetical protein
VLVKFDKIHLTGISSREYVPVIGDIMVARWSFEALAVEQFKNNKYEKLFFRHKLEESQNEYYSSFLIDKLKNDITICNKYMNNVDYRDIVRNKLKRAGFYIDQLSRLAKSVPGPWVNELNPENFNPAMRDNVIAYLDSLKRKFLRFRQTATDSKDAVSYSVEKVIGKEALVALRDEYENKKLIFIVLDQAPDEKTFDYKDKIIQKFNPGYMKPTSESGRAHFYAPVKKLGRMEIDTFWFNILVIWLVSVILYVCLYMNLFQKITTFFESLRFKRSES